LPAYGGSRPGSIVLGAFAVSLAEFQSGLAGDLRATV
jgi:hypothetical protein